jgi:hypothetical protein
VLLASCAAVFQMALQMTAIGREAAAKARVTGRPTRMVRRDGSMVECFCSLPTWSQGALAFRSSRFGDATAGDLLESRRTVDRAAAPFVFVRGQFSYGNRVIMTISTLRKRQGDRR